MYNVRSSICVLDDGRVLANLKSTNRPAWFGGGVNVRTWVPKNPIQDDGEGSYGFIPHLMSDGTCIGAVALTRKGALASMCEDDGPTASTTAASGFAPAPVSYASPVGGRDRGLVDTNVTFARPLQDGAVLLAGGRMQHIRLNDDLTHTVMPFHNLVTPISAMESCIDGATVVGTTGGAVLVWAHGEELLSAALPEPFPGAPKLSSVDDTGLLVLQDTVRKSGVLGIAALRNGRICVGARDAIVLWDPRDACMDTVDMQNMYGQPRKVSTITCALGGSHVAILDTMGDVRIWDSRMNKHIHSLSIDGKNVRALQSDATCNTIALNDKEARILRSRHLDWVTICKHNCIAAGSSVDGKTVAIRRIPQDSSAAEIFVARIDEDNVTIKPIDTYTGAM